MQARAHEFFDRLAYFHDLARQDPVLARNIPAMGRNLTGAQALRSLPDRGRLLDEHFTVTTTPIANPARPSAQPLGDRSPTTTPPPRQPAQAITSPPDAPPGHSTRICPHTGRTLRVWVNPNL